MPERIVIDTNVLVSAALGKHSTPRKVLSTVLEHHSLLASEETLAELVEVFHRPKLNKYSRIEDRINLLRALIDKATVVPINSHITDCPDPKDNKFLELAIDGKATYIISGDGDLLDMNPYRDIRIISAAEFMRILV